MTVKIWRVTFGTYFVRSVVAENYEEAAKTATKFFVIHDSNQNLAGNPITSIYLEAVSDDF